MIKTKHVVSSLALSLGLVAAAQAQTFSTNFSSGAQGSFASFAAGGSTLASLSVGSFSLSGLILDNRTDAPLFSFSLSGLSDVRVTFDFLGTNLFTPGNAPRFVFGLNSSNLVTGPVGFGSFNQTFANLGAGNYTLGFRVGNGDLLAIDNLSAQVTPVPEPATVALMLAGLGVVGAAAKRRRAQQGQAAAA